MWHRIRAPGDRAPAQQLDRTLWEIAQRFGAARPDWVMMELGIGRRHRLRALIEGF